MPANFLTIEAVVGGIDCELVAARSGREALEEISAAEFALLLIDVQMPEMDGYELAARIRAGSANRDTPIVFITAGDRDTYKLAAGYGAGAIDFLFKPIDRDVFRAKVRAFLDLYNGRRELADARDALQRSNAELETANHELRATRDQLVEAARVASFGVVIGGLTHEINNPLAYVMGHVSTISRVLAAAFSAPDKLAAEAAGTWPLVQDRLRGVQLGLERIQTLVLQLRTFARLEPGKPCLLDVAECVQSALTVLQPRLAGRISVTTRFGKPDQIESDPQLLTQGILNLIANAIDAIEDRGTIDIVTGQEGGDYVIRITDDGAGIPESIRHLVLEPFFTTKSGGKGTGLGLSTTYALVTSQGGSLELRDRQMGGTEAVLRIPHFERPRAS